MRGRAAAPAAGGEAPLALTLGEPAGICGEIACRAWRALSASGPVFFAIGDPAYYERTASDLGLSTPVAAIDSPAAAAAVFPGALPVLGQRLPAPAVAGRPDPANGAAVTASIERAVELALAGQAAGLVTNPIHKRTLYDSGFAYPGHTELLAALAGPAYRPAMMLACEGLRVVPVTIHLSLAEALTRLDADTIVAQGEITAAALRRDFAIARPRLAIAALNPHGGEDGHMGREEIEIIAPAAERLRRAGIEVLGPAPADTLFHAAARTRYDAALCMYHDQALIPLKTIDFDGGVNLTLGLPFVRASPDHGTALDIAGRGEANPASLIAALRIAREIASNRARAAGARAAV